MYDVEHTEYGLRLTISGTLDEEMAAEFARTVRSEVQNISGEFCVFADLREMSTVPPDVAENLTELMAFCEGEGMTRSVDVVDSATNSLQMEQLVEAAGINERVISSRDRDDWEDAAHAWLRDGNEP